MSGISATMKEQAMRRAGNRCEYCGLSQLGQEALFHVHHIMPLSERGATNLDNLVLSCVSCSFRKGVRFVAVDPLTGKTVPLFHPRTQGWHEHFAWSGVRVTGRSAIGRATLQVLKLNRVLAQALRTEDVLQGRHPPPKPRR
jgi:hypothetical protein